MSNLDDLYEDGYNTDNAADNASAGDYSPVPKGTYRVLVHSIERVPTKSGRGEKLKTRVDIVGPDHAGRVVFDDILIKHDSEDAQRIGRERFATLCRACGVTNPDTTDALLGNEVNAFIKVETDAEYGDRNKVSFYSAPKSGNGLSTNGAKKGFDQSFNDDDIPF